MAFEDFLVASYFNNTGKEILIAAAVLLISLLILKIFKGYVLYLLKKLAKKTKSELDDEIIDFVRELPWKFYIYISFYAATKTLTLPNIINKILKYLLIIIVIYYAVRGLQRIVDHFANTEIKKREKAGKTEDTAIVLILSKIVKVILWIIALLLVLSNLGINITPLVASLGIGGIAIAFALQNILEDLFSSFTIYFEKPFQKGDYIVLGEDSGTVEHTGLKTTRIKTLQGQELVVSNKELTNIRVENFKKMKKRRVVFHFGVEYDTSVAKMKKINKIVEEVFKSTKGADLDRVHFKNFGDFSLNYEVVYYLATTDYTKYMDTQQELNLKVKVKFEKAKIEMAFPTQTVILKK